MSPLRSDATVVGMPSCRLRTSIQAMNRFASTGALSLVSPSSRALAREASRSAQAGADQRSTAGRAMALARPWGMP